MANPYLKFNNKTVRVGSDGGRLISPFEPIPPYTLRVEFVNTPECQSAGFDPTQGTGDESAPDWAYGTWRHVYGNVYDWTYQSDTWFLKYPDRNIYASPWGLTNGGRVGTATNRFDTLAYRVVGANLTGVKYIPKLFSNAGKYLVSVALFDTSSIECAGSMFSGNGAKFPRYLTSLPNFDFSGINDESVPLGQTITWAVNNNIRGLMGFCNNERVLSATPNLVFPSGRSINTKNMYSSCIALTSATLNGLQSSDSEGIFYSCRSLTSATLSNCVLNKANRMFAGNASYPVPLTNGVTMSNVKVAVRADEMFRYSLLPEIPLFDTAELANANNMFDSCYAVESGALALYQQMSSQENVPYHTDTFTNCGRDTVTGAAELAMIPADWGGTMSA